MSDASPGDHRAYNIAIVGGGQAAKSLLMLLAERALIPDAPRPHSRVAIFERGQCIGPGLAWSPEQTLPEHLASQPGGATRAQFGREQVQVMERLVAMLGTLNVHVDLFPNVEIVDLQQDGERWAVLSATTVWRAATVVLATGHWRDSPPELLNVPHQYPWPALRLQEELIGRMRGFAHIAILGAYHTAIDAALSIALAAGRFEQHGEQLRYVPRQDLKITLLSRSGRLPLVWPIAQLPKYEPRRLHELGDPQAMSTLTLEQIEYAMSRELDERLDDMPSDRAAGKLDRRLRRIYLRDNLATLERCLDPAHWNRRNLRRLSVMAALLPRISEYFPRLDAASYVRFQRDRRSAFFNVAMPMAYPTALRVRALMRIGVLDAQPLESGRWTTSLGRPTLHRQRSHAPDAVSSFDALINGLASCGPIARHPSRLFRSLLNKGLIQPAYRLHAAAPASKLEVDGVHIDHRTCTVVPRPGVLISPDNALYAVGTNNAGLFLDAQSIGQLARDARRIVYHLSSRRGA